MQGGLVVSTGEQKTKTTTKQQKTEQATRKSVAALLMSAPTSLNDEL